MSASEKLAELGKQIAEGMNSGMQRATDRLSDFFPVYLQEKYNPKLDEDFRITTGWERDDRWRKYAMGDFEFTPTPTAMEQLNELITTSINKEKEKMFKKLNDVRVLYDGNLYAVDSIACDDGKAYEVPKYTIDFRPTRLNRRGAYNAETKVTVEFPQIKKVIFSQPALIVLWTDNTKTVVKADNEVFDPEKGIAMAIAKKVLGNKGNYFNVIRKAMNNAEVTPPKKKKVEKEEEVAAEVVEELPVEKEE